MAITPSVAPKEPPSFFSTLINATSSTDKEFTTSLLTLISLIKKAIPLVCVTISTLTSPLELEILVEEEVLSLKAFNPLNRLKKTVGSNGLPSTVKPGTACCNICQILIAYL